MLKKFSVKMVSQLNKLHKLKLFKFYQAALLNKILSLKIKVTNNLDIHNLTWFSRYFKFLKKNSKGKDQTYFMSKKYH